MKKITILIVILFLGILMFYISKVAISYSRKQSLLNTIESFESKQVFLPDSMICFVDGVSRYEAVGRTPLKYILYFSPEDCSNCIISGMIRFDHIFDLGKEMGFDVVCILTPKDEYYQEALNMLKMFPYDNPVYIDDGSFYHANINVIPEDNQLHSFLLDRDCHPVFVGYPSTDRLKDILHKVVSSYN